MDPFDEHDRIADASSRIFGFEGEDLFSRLLFQDSKVPIDALSAPSKDARRRGASGDFSTSLNINLSLTDPFEDLSSHFSSMAVSQDSADDGNGHRLRIRSTLPHWAMSSEGQAKLPLMDIVHKGLLESFARDRLGCQHLQSAYPVASPEERACVAREVLENPNLFQALACDVFGNFFIQQLIEHATGLELHWVANLLRQQMFHFCLNRYSCRVVQKALEFLPSELKSLLVCQLHHSNVVNLSVDQNANHVIQKIINRFHLSTWAFLLDSFLTDEANFFETAENKYGCRIVQLCVERLAFMEKSKQRDQYLDCMMKLIIRNCHRLTMNEFSNYVVQFIIGAAPLLYYRDHIIEKCLLGNILSMAQEKYASHVIEKAMQHAPPRLLKEMMEEIFNGYVPHPETRRDAVDIMMFHQYGNYIVQRMLSICLGAARAWSGGYELPDMQVRLAWLNRLSQKIVNNEHRLHRYSSGKKIMDMMEQIPLALRTSLPTVAVHHHDPSPVFPPFEYNLFNY